MPIYNAADSMIRAFQVGLMERRAEEDDRLRAEQAVLGAAEGEDVDGIVLLAAGGTVATLDGAPLGYGKPGFINPHFIARGRR